MSEVQERRRPDEREGLAPAALQVAQLPDVAHREQPAVGPPKFDSCAPFSPYLVI